MNLKVLLLYFLLLISSSAVASGANFPLGQSSDPISQRTPRETTVKTHPWCLSPTSTPSGKMSFPSPTGFFLLRKEEIIMVRVASKKAGLKVHFRSRGREKIEQSSLNLLQVEKRLHEFPFIKVSRSAIVNFNEIEAYEGTRRQAHLVMSDGTKVAVSRTIAGPLHDYIKGLGV